MEAKVKPFFSVDADGYVERHDTADEAKARAEKELEHESDRAADDGWHDGVEGICWGVVRQAVVMTKREETPGGRFDALEEYEMVDAPKFVDTCFGLSSHEENPPQFGTGAVMPEGTCIHGVPPDKRCDICQED
jgi:hypothetical protein